MKAAAGSSAHRPKREAELERLGTEQHKLNETLDRYFRAFEQGTMPEQACGERIAQLTQRLPQLDVRCQELAIDQDNTLDPLTDDDLQALQAHVREVVENGDPPQRKALLQALIQEVRVVSRAKIYPFFSLPVVRPPYGSVHPASHNPNQAVIAAGLLRFQPFSRRLRGDLWAQSSLNSSKNTRPPVSARGSTTETV